LQNIEQTEKDFKAFLNEMDAYQEAIALAQWDMRTKIPKKGVKQRSRTIGFFANKLHELQTSPKMKGFIDILKENTDDAVIRKTVEECEEIYNRNQKIPGDEFREYVMLQGESEAVWEEAREKSDFSLLRPYLRQLVDYNIRFANYWGYEDNIYDALLHNFEPGVTVKMLDNIFPKLRQALTSMLNQIETSNYKPDASVFKGHFPKEKQQAFTKEILHQIGYDFGAGRLDETIHPFATSLNRQDVRITTRYDEEDFRMAVFGTIHEGGHALYEQNINSNLPVPLADGTSMGIHESQSLFWENFIARSKPFWQQYIDLFHSFAPESFKNISANQLYLSANEVKPSLIRIEADELTYSLHIMIRYELEKALINEEITVDDLPGLWNEKMEKYLGIKPLSDREGVLQDIHWAGGDFGYFPTYALGYMYAAQFYHTLDKQQNVGQLIASGDFSQVKSWLSENIHQYGKMKKPLEIIRDVTGEDLNPDYLTDYLRRKYTDIYNLKSHQ